MWIRFLAAALATLAPTGLPAAGLPADAEQVSIDLPAEVVLDDAAIGGSSEASRPVVVRFSQAHLAPGRTLRLSVRTEGGAPGWWLVFATRNARGGVGRSGRIGGDELVPVFESFPWAPSGGFEISWALETPGEVRRAGRRTVTLRWRIESTPAPGWMERGGPPGGSVPDGRGIGPSAGATETGTARPGTSVWEKPDRKDRRRPPAEEVP